MSEEKNPVLVVIAGPNGSGKTTVTQKLLRHEWASDSEYINPDQVAKDLFGDWNDREAVKKAAVFCTERREKCLRERKNFVFETVFSTVDKLDFLVRAKKEGFFIRMFFVCVENPTINAARVAQRVLTNTGHDVPISKIVSRYFDAIDNCKAAAKLVDRFYLYDNSVENQNARLIYRGSEGKIIKTYTDDVPGWCQAVRQSVKKVLSVDRDMIKYHFPFGELDSVFRKGWCNEILTWDGREYFLTPNPYDGSSVVLCPVVDARRIIQFTENVKMDGRVIALSEKDKDVLSTGDPVRPDGSGVRLHFNPLLQKVVPLRENILPIKEYLMSSVQTYRFDERVVSDLLAGKEVLSRRDDPVRSPDFLVRYNSGFGYLEVRPLSEKSPDRWYVSISEAETKKTETLNAHRSRTLGLDISKTPKI